jgi:hypothetical protein
MATMADNPKSDEKAFSREEIAVRGIIYNNTIYIPKFHG